MEKPFPTLSVGGALFSADVFAVTVSRSSPRAQTYAQVRSRFLRRESTPPSQITLPGCPSLSRGFTLRPVVRTRWRLQAIEIPAHPLDHGPRRPPSVVGAVRASVQRSRELLRETGVAWSAREVRSVSPPFIPFVVIVIALGRHRLGTALGIPRLRSESSGFPGAPTLRGSR